MTTAEPTGMLECVHSIVLSALGLDSRRLPLAEDTRLLGQLPEMDSMAILAIVTAIESETGIRIDDAAIGAADFASLGSLCEFYKRQISIHAGSSAADD